MKEFDRFICGDALEVLRKLPAESIDMCMTSPPYFGLRDYGTGPDQLGLEPNPEMYIERLTEIFNEVKRVLKKEGTLWLNIGDTYGGSGCGRHDYREKGSISPMALFSEKDNPQQKIMPKCLLMIPERLAWSLIQNGWILRNKNIWHKRNSMPSSVKDRLSNTYEFVYMFSKSQRYFFDLDSVREPHAIDNIGIRPSKLGINPKYQDSDLAGNHLAIQDFNPLGKNPGDVIEIKDERKGLRVPGQAPHGIHRKKHSGYFGADGEYLVNPLGANPGDFWEINTQPFPEAHFAVFPEKLCEKPIRAGCPEEVCRKCGKARKRIIKKFTPSPGKDLPNRKGKRYGESTGGGHGKTSILNMSDGDAYTKWRQEHPDKTIGWTACNCKAGFEPGVVLDLFAGAGTVGVVAKSMGRRFILIDIKEEYMKMAERRVAQVGHQKELFK